MKTRAAYWNIVLNFGLLVIAACGCNPLNKTSDASITQTLIADTLTVTPRVILAAPITITPHQAITPVARVTSLPTLSVDQKSAFVKDLFQTNGGCRLPCWWGITPGATSWNTAMGFLDTFAWKISLVGSDADPPQVAYASFKVSDDKGVITVQHIYTGRNGVIETIEIGPEYDASAYHLDALLSSYGPPDEVWIRTYSHEEQNSLPFGIALFYSQQGILAEYYTAGYVKENLVQGCPHRGMSIFLYLWNPRQSITFSEATRKFMRAEDRSFLPLSEATEMDVETFYRTFKVPDTSCLETSAELWP